MYMCVFVMAYDRAASKDCQTLTHFHTHTHTHTIPQLNIANPSTGQQHVVELEDEKRLRAFYDRRISQEVDGEHIGDEFKGFVFRISGGNDKQGFPMKQGVLTDQRVRLLLRKGLSCYRARRKGERKRKSVRGAIVGPDLSVLNLVVVKRGEEVSEELLLLCVCVCVYLCVFGGGWLV